MPIYGKIPHEIKAEKGSEIVEHPELYNVQIRYSYLEGWYEVYNHLHGSWIKFDPGNCMIRVDCAPDDVYPIDNETFSKTYVYTREN